MDARTRVSSAIREIVSTALFTLDREVNVVLFNTAHVFRFDDAGSLMGQAGVLPQLQAGFDDYKAGVRTGDPVMDASLDAFLTRARKQAERPTD